MCATAAARAWNERASGAHLNYYLPAYLGNAAGAEVLAFAGRTDGLIKLELDVAGIQTRTTTLTAPDVDVIDVCSLRSERWPFAVAAFRLDGSVILVRDVLGDDQPETLQFDGIQGTPYGIRCAQGHLFLLTSELVTVIPNFAHLYLGHERLAQPLHSRHRDVQAADIFVANEKELIVLTAEDIEFDDIATLTKPRTAAGSPEARSGVSDWTYEEGIPKILAYPARWESCMAC